MLISSNYPVYGRCLAEKIAQQPRGIASTFLRVLVSNFSTKYLYIRPSSIVKYNINASSPATGINVLYPFVRLWNLSTKQKY